MMLIFTFHPEAKMLNNISNRVFCRSRCTDANDGLTYCLLEERHV